MTRVCLHIFCFVLSTLALTSCAAGRNGSICERFERGSKEFSKMLRWHEVESAGMAHLRSDLRDSYLNAAAGLKRRGVTITDYRILTTECLADKDAGEVLVEFDYYVLPSNRIKTQLYRQAWEYNGTDGWRLKSVLPPFE